MNPRLAEILARREALIARAAIQRAEIAQAYRRWERPLGLVAWGCKAFHFAKSHPLLIVGAAAALVASRRIDPVKWARRAWFAWRMYRSVGLLGKFIR